MAETMDENTDLNTAKTHLERHMETLFERAMALAEVFYDFQRKRNATMDWAQKSTLQLRVRQRGLSLSAEWYEKRWFGSKAKGTRNAFRTYIGKPKASKGYTLSKLLSYAQEWEKDKVTEIETALAAIRYDAGCTMKAISFVSSALEKTDHP